MNNDTAPEQGRYTERIAKGAALLDEKAPGWRSRVDADTLEMSSCARCVLGQLDGRGDHDWLNITERFSVDAWDGGDILLGFNLSSSDEQVGGGWTQLAEEWKQYILATRGSA